MKLKDLKEDISSCLHDIAFEYHGKPGLINPWHEHKIELGYGDYAGCYSDIDSLLSDKVIDGKSLSDLCGDIDFVTV